MISGEFDKETIDIAQEDVERRIRGILEGVTNGVSDPASLQLLGLFQLQRLAEFVRGVPGISGVRRQDRHPAITGDVPRRIHEALRADAETDEHRGQDRIGAWGDQVLLDVLVKMVTQRLLSGMTA